MSVRVGREKERLETFPFLHDKDCSAGELGYYFWQDLWAAKKIFNRRPETHFDIASRIDGFVAHLLTFMPVTLIDIRPLPFQVEGINFSCADATHLTEISDESIESLSSLCAIEHFGLGRYGDPVNPEACFSALRALQRVLRKGGRLYLAVPIGAEAVYFNAHRVFSPFTILRSLEQMELLDFAVVDARNGNNLKYVEHADPTDYSREENPGGSLVGLFEFGKK
jgi:hypothetical protein